MIKKKMIEKATHLRISELSNLNKEVRRENAILFNWVFKNYGRRCPKYEKNCVICQAWKNYDNLEMYEFNERNAKKLLHQRIAR